MPDTPSMHEIIRRRRETGFVGRQEPLARFRENLSLPVDDPSHRFLFNVHGQPGAGKSFLLRRLYDIALEHGARCATIDERVPDVPGTMASIASQLGRQQARLRAFERRHQRYEERKVALMADPPGLTGGWLLLARLAVRLGLRAARTVPVAGIAADVVEPDMVLEQADNLHGLLSRVLRSRDDAHLVLAPTEELTPLFVQDLQHVAAHHPVALFIDGYERTAPLLESWLLDLVERRAYGDLPGGMTITVAGRERLDPHRWAGLLTEIEDIELGPFTEAEARQLLANKDVRDEAVVDAIFALSGRLPLQVAMLAEGSPIDPAALGRPGSDAVEQFLRWETDERRREVALLASLPRRVDADTLAELTGDEDVAELYEWLRGRSFVTERDGACSYHELVRGPLLRVQRARAPMRWRRDHRRLAEFHRDCRRELDLPDAEGWADATWQHHRREETYHRLCATPVAALGPALAGALHAYRAGRPLARRWAEMLVQAGADADAREVARWGAELSAAAGDDEGCWIDFVTALLDGAPLTRPDRALALSQRAECHLLDRRFTAAEADLSEAIAIDPDDPDLLIARAQTLRAMARNEDALRDFDRAIELAPGSETAYGGRGVVRRRLGRFDDAIADLTRAVELRPNDEWALAHRGETYRMMGRHRLAVADFSEAIRLDPAYAFAHASRALARRRLGHHREELADLDRAIELSPGYEWAYAQRGVTHRSAGRHDLAIADLTRAVELDPENAWALANRGVTLRQTGRYHEAIADLDGVLRLTPDDGWALANRGVTLRQTGRYHEALADLERAVRHRPNDAWTLANRGETLRLLGRDREAVADLERAIELRPSAWALARRGEARRRLGDLEGARADFDRALDLDPREGSARFGRALLLFREGRRDEATVELDAAAAIGRRSLEVRPDDHVALLRQAVVEAAAGRVEAAVPLAREALARGARGALLDATVRDLRELVAGGGAGDGAALLELLVGGDEGGQGDGVGDRDRSADG